MKLEIKAMVQGKPAYCVIDLPRVTWVLDDATVRIPADLLPESIQRVDLVDEFGKRMTLRLDP